MEVKQLVLITAGVSVFVSFLFGLMAGWLSFRPSSSSSSSSSSSDDLAKLIRYNKLINQNDPQEGHRRLDSELQASEMEKHLRYLTSIGHMAGTKGDKESAVY